MRTDPNLIAGIEGFEDAGVYRLSPDLAIILTLDFFTPIVDDPYLFGQIAATNALSDVYAMGGKPITAMNIICFPPKKLPMEVLNRILQGGLGQDARGGRDPRGRSQRGGRRAEIRPLRDRGHPPRPGPSQPGGPSRATGSS